jgi:regulator of PEP synthase PpsR (kinase-PPPase family)
MSSSYSIGKTHGIHNNDRYKTRIDAINFTLNADDGVNVSHYEHADIILVGVSRSGKTPTCLYLAMQFGIFAANYPITEEDLPLKHLPLSLQTYRHKIYGLTITPDRLHMIREERRSNTRYASLAQCRTEVAAVENLFHQEKIP